tara:strand:- start:407 stop:802 length:396 start_codon:yes stop_codon:yes gene_type:complete
MSERSTKWQRDNFSNKQILEYLSLLKIDATITGAPGDREWNIGWNDAIESLEEMFHCLDLPDREFGAMAFNKETEMFEHIGEEPKDAKQLRRTKEEELKERAASKEVIEISSPALSAIFQGADQYSIPLAD